MRTSNYHYRAIIVAPAADQPGINEAVKANLDPAGGDLTLSVGLNPEHYWCHSGLTHAGVFGDERNAGLLQLAPNFPNSTGYVWSDPADPERLAWLREAFENVPNVHVGEVTGQQVLDFHDLSVPTEG